MLCLQNYLYFWYFILNVFSLSLSFHPSLTLHRFKCRDYFGSVPNLHLSIIIGISIRTDWTLNRGRIRMQLLWMCSSRISGSSGANNKLAQLREHHAFLKPKRKKVTFIPMAPNPSKYHFSFVSPSSSFEEFVQKIIDATNYEVCQSLEPILSI